jgi:PBSX family phage terminase large subunit
MSAAPTLTTFDPSHIPFQGKVIHDLEKWDYSESTPELLLSGAYGSSKSTLGAHIVVKHCLNNPGAVACIGRRTLPDLKQTVFSEIIDHIGDNLVEGVDYRASESTARIWFSNGSKVIPATWADKRYKKFRSRKISLLLIEEAAENDEDDMEAFMQLKARLRRVPGIRENICLLITNPDSPEHWIYKYFMESSFESRRVYYSKTSDNPFLDPVYIKQLRQDLDPKAALRYLHGKWLDLVGEVIYYSYNPDVNHVEAPYIVKAHAPIWLNFDFNIGHNKPMSVCLFQVVENKVHVFSESIIHGARTQDVLDDIASKGLLDFDCPYNLAGDASGSHRDTRNNRSDYDIIRKFLSNYERPHKGTMKKLDVEFRVPNSNPAIRKRHNLVNAYCKNDLGEVRLFTYQTAPTTKKGLMLTKLKKGADYIEDDSKDYQHVTTALGYGLVALEKHERNQEPDSGSF